MLNQQRSGNLARLKYLLSLPIIAGLLCTSTLAFSKSYGLVDIAPAVKSDTPKRVHFMVDDNVHNITTAYTTTKGFDVVEDINTHNNVVVMKVVITDKDKSKHTYYDDKITTTERKMLMDKYGFTFINRKVKLLPPPPPAPNSLSGKNVKIAPPTVNELPPPPPPAPPIKKFKPAPPTAHVKPTFTSEGYRYEEDGYSINGKTDFRVIIVEKDGSQVAYFKSKASAADLKLLKEKYGYTFPVMEIYTKLPPPPPTVAPIAPAKRMPPPPPAPPKTSKLLQDWQSIPGFFTQSRKNC